MTERMGGCRMAFTPSVYQLVPRSVDKVPIWRLVTKLDHTWNWEDGFDACKQYSQYRELYYDEDVLVIPELRNNNKISSDYVDQLPFHTVQVAPRKYCMLTTSPHYETVRTWLNLAFGLVDPTQRPDHNQILNTMGGSFAPLYVEEPRAKAQCGCERIAYMKYDKKEETSAMVCSKHWKVVNTLNQ